VLDVLICICSLVWDGEHMYIYIRLICIAFYKMTCNGVCELHEFPKSLECHVSMCDKVMTSSRLHEMAYVWSACNTLVPQRTRALCIHV
jgi:hypothetical protein